MGWHFFSKLPFSKLKNGIKQAILQDELEYECFIWCRSFCLGWNLIELLKSGPFVDKNLSRTVLCKPIEMFYQSFHVEKRSKWNQCFIRVLILKKGANEIQCISMHWRLTHFKMREQFIHFPSLLDCRFSPIISLQNASYLPPMRLRTSFPILLKIPSGATQNEKNSTFE